ncbi:hypothetical protein A3C17_04565 [Candidatus Uhrbacteria bacterium RIFCSPHIGHO2_02_FULL_53_13]|uniref:Uncharacterized protein n=2 Tax=Candidatus Uhriibacteriota TaxID=1752732 RepID=A0A1F7U180_9BACT|nr:MAG: hypothetical protein A3C17_04565 [Candidatus Uhrbacteria bacterium RIFCSPHIGHO2_02_FULL_53_13]
MTHIRWFRVSTVLMGGAMLSLILLGVGCPSKNNVVTDERTLEFADSGVSAFTGLDGSLTQFAFDTVAESFTAYLLKGTVVEHPNQEIFAVWMEAQSDVPVNDTFQNPIKLRSNEARSFTLWTEGEDGVQDTSDDYFKTFRY